MENNQTNHKQHARKGACNLRVLTMTIMVLFLGGMFAGCLGSGDSGDETQALDASSEQAENQDGADLGTQDTADENETNHVDDTKESAGSNNDSDEQESPDEEGEDPPEQGPSNEDEASERCHLTMTLEWREPDLDRGDPVDRESVKQSAETAHETADCIADRAWGSYNDTTPGKKTLNETLDETHAQVNETLTQVPGRDLDREGREKEYDRDEEPDKEASSKQD